MSGHMGGDVARNRRILTTESGMPKTRRASELDRESRLLLHAMNGAFPLVGRAINRERVSSFRYAWAALASTFGRRIPLAGLEERQIRGPDGNAIPLRIYTPDGPPGLKPAFLWCHGGGFVVGDLNTSDGICRAIARASGAIVISVRYRLAPEHDIYAGREDFLAALNWVHKNAEALGIDGNRLGVGGDSAGGNISAAVAQENIRRGGPRLSLQALVYPATNLAMDFDSKDENSKGFLLTANFMDSLRPLIERGEDLTDPWLSPAHADSVAGLPPAVIITAGFDPIRDDGLLYAAQLRRAGVPVELLHYSGQFHGFFNFDAVLGAARDAQERVGVALRDAFAGEPAPNRTIEIADNRPWFDARLSKDLITGAMLAGRSVRQWNSHVLRSLSPETAYAAANLLRPFWAPAAMARRTISGCINALNAQQSYPPQAGAPSA
ncbi:hypothetical protein GCM10019059_43260 [Camelimonas fluminis]|nr:hypothetical protein GCM10019059_43260 [Camelimonas fluminis]